VAVAVGQVSASSVRATALAPELLDAGLLEPELAPELEPAPELELELEPASLVVAAPMITEAVVGVPKSAFPATEVRETLKLLVRVILPINGIEMVWGVESPLVHTSEPLVGEYSVPDVAVPLTVV
jgi:hypothetical protein